MKKTLDIIVIGGGIVAIYLAVFKLKPYMEKRKKEQEIQKAKDFVDGLVSGRITTADFDKPLFPQNSDGTYCYVPPCRVI